MVKIFVVCISVCVADIHNEHESNILKVQDINENKARQEHMNQMVDIKKSIKGLPVTLLNFFSFLYL